MFKGRKNIVPKDLKNPLIKRGRFISCIDALFTKLLKSAEYFKDARYINIVTMEKGSESIGIL